MSKLTTLILAACLTATGAMTAQVPKTVHVETAGTLSTLFTEEEKTTVTDLVVTGNIDKSDIYFMASLTRGSAATDFLPRNKTGVLRNIDFSEARVSGDSIPEGAFERRSLIGKVAVPNSIKVIDKKAFDNLRTSSPPFKFQYPTELKEIGTNAFASILDLDNFDLPEGLEIIGTAAFKESWISVSEFVTLTIPSTVTSLGGNVFLGNALGKVYNHGTAPLHIATYIHPSFGETNNNTFSEETLATATLYVPKASIDAYKETAVWKDFSAIEAIEDATVLPTVKTTETAYGYVANNALTVNGLTGTAVVTLTGLSGKTLLRKTVSSGASIPLNALGKGIYVVKIGDKTNKIVIK